MKKMQSYTKDIQFDLIVPGVKAISHKQALLTMAQKSAEFLNIREKIMCERISSKEKLGNSAIGNGIAIPHFKMRRIQSPFTLLMTLHNEIKHETPDGTNIDLYCLLISPLNDGPIHLRRLSRLSRLFKNDTLRKRIRETQDPDIVHSLLMDPQGWFMAA